MKTVIPIISEDSDLPDAPTAESLNTDFLNTNINNWNDWRWQIRNSITNSVQLHNILGKNSIELPKNHLPFRITPYFANVLNSLSNDHPLYKTIVPNIFELSNHLGEKTDPLCEENDSPVKGIVHRYPDRALFLVTGFCSTYCRYCTRSHLVSQTSSILRSNWEEGFKYLEKHTEIRDVIISGGDPLTLNDESIEYILQRLRNIKHIEIIRIGTKIPVVLPMRITDDLVNMLKKYHPLYMSIHFTHPDEITKEVIEACNKLANAGVPLGSQTVLLKDVNDNVPTMKELMHKLLLIRVRPYYIYQCDPIPGSEHFRTKVEKGIEIIKGLRGHTSGYAVPHFVIDAPGGGGKIPLIPNYVKEINDEGIILTNYQNKQFLYPS